MNWYEQSINQSINHSINQSLLVYDKHISITIDSFAFFDWFIYVIVWYLDLVFVKREGLVIPLVKAGTPRKLIERLVPEKYPGRTLYYNYNHFR